MKVWVDDQRPAPEGWVQCWNIREAEQFIEENKESITHIAFDYYLSEDNRYHTGLLLIQHLWYKNGRKVFSQPKENYTFHSSDDYMNSTMMDFLYSRLEPNTDKPKKSMLEKLRSSKGRR